MSRGVDGLGASPGSPGALGVLVAVLLCATCQDSAPWMLHGVNTTFTWASAKLLPHGGAFTLDLTTKRHLQSAGRQLGKGKEGSARLFPWSIKSLCLGWCCVCPAQTWTPWLCWCRSSSIQGLGVLLDPSRIPPDGLGLQCPCSASCWNPPADVQLEKAHQLCITSSRYCPILPHFQAFCWFCQQTGIVWRIRVNDSYSKLLLSEVLKNQSLCDLKQA